MRFEVDAFLNESFSTALGFSVDPFLKGSFNVNGVGPVPPVPVVTVEQGGGVPYWPTYESYDRWRKQKKVRDRVLVVDGLLIDLAKAKTIGFDMAEQDLAELMMLEDL